MTALLWFLSAVLIGLPTRPGSERTNGRRRSPRRRLTDLRRLQALAVVAFGALTLLVFAPPSGPLLAVLGAPVAANGVARLHQHAARSASITRARETPLTLTMIAAGLRGGAPLPKAVEAATVCADPATATRLTAVVGLLRLGAEPQQAWIPDDRDEVWSSIVRVARQSSQSGTRMAAAFDLLAHELRARRRSSDAARVERAGVFAVAPLGLCFLPAFLCLGIVPVVIGIFRGLGLRAPP